MLKWSLSATRSRITRLQSDHQMSGAENTLNSGATNESSNTNLSADTDLNSELAQLHEEANAAVNEIESLFLPFAISELDRLDTLRKSHRFDTLAEQCIFSASAVLQTFTARLEEWLSLTNETAHLLLNFSLPLHPPTERSNRSQAENNVEIVHLIDSSEQAFRGVQMGKQAVRFVNGNRALDELKARIDHTLEEWWLTKTSDHID